MPPTVTFRIYFVVFAFIKFAYFQQVPPGSTVNPTRDQGHKKYHSHNFGDKNDIQDQEHIKSHLDGQMNTEKKMDEEQTRYHYFKMYDYNNDDMIDGVEMIKAITHSHPYHDRNGNVTDSSKMSDLELEQQIDQVLNMYDLDKNGYIDYAEYLKAYSKPDKT